MRPIKFRAWDGESMYWPSTSLWDGGFTCMGDDIFMQYTGLKDKNGVEIYEGDIINDDYHIYEVKFGEQDVGHDWQGIGFYLHVKEEWPWPANIYEGCGEVIGNIYEHKELLE